MEVKEENFTPEELMEAAPVFVPRINPKWTADDVIAFINSRFHNL